MADTGAWGNPYDYGGISLRRQRGIVADDSPVFRCLLSVAGEVDATVAKIHVNRF
jgi:hypothetical protein